jgi:hypothetical protein
MKVPTIIIFPRTTKENRYIERIHQILATGNFEVFSYSFFKLFKNLLSNKKYIYISWIENQTRERGLTGLFLVVGFCILVKLLNYKIIWVRHNIKSHNIEGVISILLNRVAVKYMHLISSNIVCHGIQYSSVRGLSYVPHPLYKVHRSVNDTHKKDYYLVCGRITSYKKIENFLQQCPECTLMIAGKFEPEYKIKLEQFIKESNATVNVIDRYIDDEELNNLITNSKAVILTNDGESSIVSGMVFHVLELGSIIITTSKELYSEIGLLNKFYYLNDFSEIDKAREMGEVGFDVLDKHADKEVFRALKDVFNG